MDWGMITRRSILSTDIDCKIYTSSALQSCIIVLQYHNLIVVDFMSTWTSSLVTSRNNSVSEVRAAWLSSNKGTMGPCSAPKGMKGNKKYKCHSKLEWQVLKFGCVNSGPRIDRLFALCRRCSFVGPLACLTITCI